MNTTPATRFFIVRLITKEILEQEDSGKATVLLTREGPVPEKESELVEELVKSQYLQQHAGRVVTSCKAILVTRDRYNTERILLTPQVNKGKP